MGTPPAPRVTGIRTVFANDGAVAAATSAAVSSTLFIGPSCARKLRGRAASSEGGFLEEGSSPCAPLKTKLRGPIRRCERDCQPGRKTQVSTLSEHHRAIDCEGPLALAKEERDRRNLEGERAPSASQLREPVLELRATRCLAHAQVGYEAVFVAGHFVAIGKLRLQRRLELDEWFRGVQGEPDRESIPPVREELHLRERRAKARHGCASAAKNGIRLIEHRPWPERIEQREVRHPALEVPVVAPADRLDGFPQVALRNHDHGGLVRLHGLPPASRADYVDTGGSGV